MARQFPVQRPEPVFIVREPRRPRQGRGLRAERFVERGRPLDLGPGHDRRRRRVRFDPQPHWIEERRPRPREWPGGRYGAANIIEREPVYW